MLTRKDSAAKYIAVTMGDPAGVGPDITLAAWQARKQSALPPFFVIGDSGLFEDRIRSIGLEIPVRTISAPEDTADVFDSALPVLSVPLASPVAPGAPAANSAPAIVGAIEKGVDLIHEGAASALVTNPINKALLLDTGFAHPGHTEFLGELARGHGDDAFPVMMLVCDALRVVPATVHIPLSQVPAALNEALILRTITVTADALRQRFGIASPRIAVTGLNPHAGESGALGREEIEIIGPAIEKARQSTGAEITGPYPADTIFQDRLRGTYDAVIAMYHDQALVPVKTIAFDEAVNLTLGLPFIRTSPDHGTAYDLAGTGRANASSLIAAIKLAARLGANARTTA